MLLSKKYFPSNHAMEVFPVIMLLPFLVYLFFILLMTRGILNGDINIEVIERLRRYRFNQEEHQDEDERTAIENAQYIVARANIENSNVSRRRSMDALYWI